MDTTGRQVIRYGNYNKRKRQGKEIVMKQRGKSEREREIITKKVRAKRKEEQIE